MGRPSLGVTKWLECPDSPALVSWVILHALAFSGDIVFMLLRYSVVDFSTSGIDKANKAQY